MRRRMRVLLTPIPRRVLLIRILRGRTAIIRIRRAAVMRPPMKAFPIPIPRRRLLIPILRMRMAVMATERSNHPHAAACENGSRDSFPRDPFPTL